MHMQSAYRTHVPHAYAAAADPIVSTEWLAARLNEVTVLDVRGCVDAVELKPGVERSTYVASYDAYLAGHIPVGFNTHTLRDLCSLMLIPYDCWWRRRFP
jgi:hypothetical protein